jgi:hypothetical protein
MLSFMFCNLKLDEFALVSEMNNHLLSNQEYIKEVFTNTCMCIKIHNKLQPFIQNASDNSSTFKTLLKKFLYANSFCTMDILIILQHRFW